MKSFNIESAPIQIHGLATCTGGIYHRLPEDMPEKVNENIPFLHTHTAGARVRFATDSDTLRLEVRLTEPSCMSHMPLSGSSGVDLYVNGRFVNNYRPLREADLRFSSDEKLPGEGRREIELFLPLYNGISKLMIHIDDNARIWAPRAYKYPKPVIFYGSSITQGACASRPSNCYTNALCRRLDTEIRSLGFSGAARGEEIMARYIATLDASVFVLDYDYNAPSPEHLQKTHKPFYDIVRAARPELPIIMMSRPNFDASNAEAILRRSIVKATYDAAIAAGDKNVYYIDGEDLFQTDDRDACTIEGCHPTDLGFYRMACTVMPVLKPLLDKAL